MSEEGKRGPIGLGEGVSWSRAALLAVPSIATAAGMVATITHPAWNEPFFVHATYYALLLLGACYLAIQGSRIGGWLAIRDFVREHRLGLLVTLLVAGIVILAVPASFRVLADEANLAGVSRNFFYQRTANFTVQGKWYFENFWDLNVVTDRRPALFPFLTSLVHFVRGYDAHNAFTVNAIVLGLYVFASYRLGRSFGGDVVGITAAILVAVNPNAMVAARSGGFDLLATLLTVCVVNGFVDYARKPSAAGLASLALHLCLLAHVRYEGWAMAFAVMFAVAFFKLAKREHFRGYGWFYALVPLLLVPRFWQSVAKAKDAEQPLSATLFSMAYLKSNLNEYFGQVLNISDPGIPHAPVLIVLGSLGLLLSCGCLWRSFRRKELGRPELAIVAVMAGLFAMHFVLCFSYNWGKSTHAAAARLFVWLDTVMAIAAAWPLTLLGRHLPLQLRSLGRASGAPATVLIAALLLFMHLPASAEARFANTLIVTRDAAECWRFFERLQEKRILILSDRPGLYTIMEYGAADLSTANRAGLLLELSRKLYKDIYLIQEIDLNTKRPRKNFDPWPDVEVEPMYEFQNTDSSHIRIGRVNKRALRI